MRFRYLCLPALVLALTAALPLPAAELGVLAPVMDGDSVQTRPGPDKQPAPVVTEVKDGELYAALQKEAQDGFTATLLVMDERAQKTAGAKTPGPTWLFLAKEEGGFARRGFWLKDDKQERWVDAPFVDLVVDPASVADGSFEEIFAHELGHVFLRRLLPHLPEGYSRAPHGSMTITDDATAFDEGFAIHMQALARRLTRNERLKAQDLGLEYKPFVPLWLSNLDRTLRIEGMRNNWFIHRQLALPGSGDAIARRDLSTLFDTARLKNGNQMLASEGVIATLFYRALVPGPVEREPLLSRYQRLFDALAEMNHRELTPDTPLFLELAETYARDNPEDGARILRLIVETTYGATADPTLARQTEALAEKGRLGDIEGFVAELKPARAAMLRLEDAVVRSPRGLRAGLGPAIWLLNGNARASRGEDAPDLTLNLNTAEKEQLMTLPDIDDAVAERLLDSRRNQGTFRNLDDFIARGGLSPEAGARLAGMAAAMEQAGTYHRQ